jgi:hypothetical protein
MAAKDPQYSTPAIPANAATFIAHATVRINGSAALVFRTLRNTETWKDWNRFTPKATIKHQPEEDDATNAEYRDLVVEATSRALSVDSDIASSLPPSFAYSSSRRASTSSNGPSAAQKFEDAKNERRASVGSNASRTSKTDAADHVLASPHGILLPLPSVQPSPFTPGTPTKRGSVSGNPAVNAAVHAAQANTRRHSIITIYGEPSVRLMVGTTLTLHTCMKLPHHPTEYKDYAVRVIEVSRPDDPALPEESNPLLRSNTHTPSVSGVYRIVWGTENSSSFPKFILQFQRVTEIRSVYRGDGKEESEVKMWEGWKGFGSKKIDKAYVQKWLEQTALGLRDFCESFGGAVDRCDWAMAAP